MPAKLTSRLPGIIKALPARVEHATREGAEFVAEATRQRAPVSDDPPHIKNRITVREAESGLHAFESNGRTVAENVLVQHGYWVVIGDNETYYGHMIEFGTTKTPAQPFAVPAAEASKDVVETGIAASLRGL